MKTTLLTLWAALLLCLNLSYSQENLQRLEIEVDDLKDVFYETIPLGEKGFITLSRNDKDTRRGVKIYRLDKYGPDLKKQWETEVPIEKKLYFNDWVVSNDYVFLIVKESDKKKTDAKFFQIDTKSGNFKFIDALLPNLSVNHAVGLNGNLYIAGNVGLTTRAQKNRAMYTYALCCIPLAFGSMDFETNAMMVKVDFDQNKTEIFKTIFEGSSAVASLNKNRHTKEIEAILVDLPEKRGEKAKRTLRVFDETGSYDDMRIKTGSGREITGNRLTATSPTERVLIGSYTRTAEEKKKSKRKRKTVVSSGGSEGLFFSKIADGKQLYIKFYPFRDFSSFYTSLSKKAVEKAKGELIVSYDVLLHDIIHKDNEYILVGEAYYPEYETRTSMDANGNTTTYTVFVGFRFTHAIIAAFNDEGELLWENSFEIKDILSKNLSTKIQVLDEADYTVLAYNYGGALHSMVLRDGKVETEKTTDFLNTGHEKDKVKENYASELDLWYDNYFIASGFQEIKNKDDRKSRKEEDIKKKRTVFYINKIEFK